MAVEMDHWRSQCKKRAHNSYQFNIRWYMMISGRSQCHEMYKKHLPNSIPSYSANFNILEWERKHIKDTQNDSKKYMTVWKMLQWKRSQRKKDKSKEQNAEIGYNRKNCSTNAHDSNGHNSIARCTNHATWRHARRTLAIHWNETHSKQSQRT